MKRLIALLLLLGLAPFASAALVTDGLIIHLDAGTLGLNNGDSVSTWADLAVGGPDGTVSTVDGIENPTFKTNAINGYAAVSFGGNDILSTSLTSTFSLTSAGTTMFAVFTGGATGAKTERLAQIGNVVGTGGQVIGLEVSTNKNEAPETDGGSGFRFNNGKDLMQANNPLTTGFHAGAWQMGQAALHSTAAYYVDGELQIFDVIANPANKATLPATGNIFSLGNGRIKPTGSTTGSWIAGDYYTGDLAEILVYNGMLSTAQIDEVNAYLMTKYDIPEPATLVLLGLGSLLAVRCRKA